MRIGTTCPLPRLAHVPELLAAGFEFIEITQTIARPISIELPSVPYIWQCPPDLPAEHPDRHVQEGVLASWRAHLGIAQTLPAALMVVQFRRPASLPDKAALIDQYTALLTPLSQEARAAGVQLLLRNGPDNRDQLQLLREIVRRVPHLGVALDIAYAHHQVVRNLSQEYLWDSDLGNRIAHIYASDSTGQDATLRLPLGSLGTAGIPWRRLVQALRERYNASITLDHGDATADYLALSLAKLREWWQG